MSLYLSAQSEGAPVPAAASKGPSCGLCAPQAQAGGQQVLNSAALL